MLSSCATKSRDFRQNIDFVKINVYVISLRSDCSALELSCSRLTRDRIGENVLSLWLALDYHISPSLIQLHLRPVRARVQCKLYIIWCIHNNQCPTERWKWVNGSMGHFQWLIDPWWWNSCAVACNFLFLVDIGWWFGLAVTRWSWSTKLLYARPG